MPANRGDPWGMDNETCLAITCKQPQSRRQEDTQHMAKFPSIELFAGAGGLALGTAQAGFEHTAVLEWDSNACRTLRRNQTEGVEHVRDWEIVEGDVKDYDFQKHAGSVDFIFGGPPCQPFSLGGKHLGKDDHRNMFPEAVRAVRDIQPKAFMFENVKGLLRQSFANYYNYILKQFTFPTVLPKKGEDWQEHHARLERLLTAGRHSGLRYNVVPRLLNAFEYGFADGVPQRRERVIFVGIRSDLGVQFSFPNEPTHSYDALLHDKWVSGNYWERHAITKKHRPHAPSPGKIDKLRMLDRATLGQACRTVRDAIFDLPRIAVGERSKKIANHFLNPGARSYPGHDGSPFDEPAKALKAGDHGVPGGENTLRFDDGSVRYFSVRECARLQTFPDQWIFEGSWTESMRQLGNAVPVRLAELIANRLRETVERVA